MTTHLPPEEQFGYLHNTILIASRDADSCISDLPSLMLAMLKKHGWRKFRRPRDRKEFANETIDEWVLGKPYGGLGFPDWRTVYGFLECNTEHGPECIRLLHEVGAPSYAASVMMEAGDVAPRVIGVEGGKAGPGRGKKTGAISTRLPRGSTSATYLAARIKRDHPEIAAAVERGEYRTIRAAAKAAGIVRDPTPLEHMQKWWRKASLSERAEFDAWRTSEPAQ